MELGWGKRWLEERFEEGGDAGGVHGDPGEILAGVIVEVQFLSAVFSVPTRGSLARAPEETTSDPGS